MSEPWSCERCKGAEATSMWNPDNLGGHEILVCTPCLRGLEASLAQWEEEQHERYLARHPWDA